MLSACEAPDCTSDKQLYWETVALLLLEYLCPPEDDANE